MFYKNRVCQHLGLLGLEKKEASRFSSLIQKWHDNSGPEWTVSRLKSLELYAKERYKSLKTGAPKPPIPSGIKSHETRKYPIRFDDDLLHELFTSNHFNLERALQFCRAASGLHLVTPATKHGKVVYEQMPPTKSQTEKLLTAIEGPVPLELVPETMFLYSEYRPDERYLSALPGYTDISITPMIYWPLNTTSAPFFNEEGIVEQAPRNQEQRCWSLEILYTDYEFARFMNDNIDYVSSCILGDSNYRLPKPHPGSAMFSKPIGRLNPIQELGCKLRPAASPFLAVQAINEPLKNILSRIERRIPQIVTHNQEGGIDTLQEWISSNKEVWSLDASSFTDRFPVDYQLEVLRSLLSSDRITQAMYDAFSLTVNKQYYAEFLGRNIGYLQGQSQGLGPSFSIATYSHYDLLRNMCNYLGISSDNFRVLGDDVIIADKQLSILYRNWMNSCNVEINLTKSVISSHLGEFAGAQVTSDEIIKRPKAKPLKSNDSLISLYDIMSHRYKSNFFVFMMEEDIRPLTEKMSLPEDFGGRRYDLVVNASELILDLNNFSIQKARILKDLKSVYSFSSKSLSSFLEGKDWITTGIIHSSHSYLDNAAREFVDTIDIVNHEFSHETKTVKLALLEEVDEAGLISEVQALVTELKQRVKNTRQLVSYLATHSKWFTKDGYIRSELALTLSDGRSFLENLSSPDLDIVSSHAKKRKEGPTNTGWKSHIKKSKPRGPN